MPEDNNNFKEVRWEEIPIDWSKVEYDVSDGLLDRHSFTTKDLLTARVITSKVADLYLSRFDPILKDDFFEQLKKDALIKDWRIDGGGEARYWENKHIDPDSGNTTYTVNFGLGNWYRKHPYTTRMTDAILGTLPTDGSVFKKPPEMVQELWNLLPKMERHKLINTFPHPERVVVQDCGGNTPEKRNHTKVMRLQKWSWEEPKEGKYGKWTFTYEFIKYSLPDQKVPQTIDLSNGETYDVEISESMAICPQCKEEKDADTV